MTVSIFKAAADPNCEFTLGPDDHVDAKDSWGRSLLHIAAENGNAAAIAHLVARHANLELERTHPWILSGSTPLIVASDRGHAPVVAMLIEAGANIEHRGVRGSTALIRAVRGGHGEVVRLLLAQGADPDLCDHDGIGPLHLAAKYDRPEFVELLLQFGADPTSQTTDGRIPRNFCSRYEIQERLDRAEMAHLASDELIIKGGVQNGLLWLCAHHVKTHLPRSTILSSMNLEMAMFVYSWPWNTYEWLGIVPDVV